LDVTIIAAFFITFANLVVDVVYAFLDPRVRYNVSPGGAEGTAGRNARA